MTIALVGIEKRAGLAENHPGHHLAIAVAAWMLVARKIVQPLFYSN